MKIKLAHKNGGGVFALKMTPETKKLLVSDVTAMNLHVLQ
jgi:hypothetical protein